VGHPDVKRLYPDSRAAEESWYRSQKIFPIMHLVGVRRSLADQHPWLPGAVFKAFNEAKAKALELLADTSATKVTLPFVDERLAEARAFMGEDFWSYGVAPNRKTLESFFKHHHAQGLSPRLVTPEDVFHPSTLESFKL
jgi:4,5-dihydroxyphthalate decarboxylase